MHRRRRGCNWSVCSAARSAASPLDRNHTRRRVPSSAADAAAAAADDDGATKAMDAESVYLQPCWCLWSYMQTVVSLTLCFSGFSVCLCVSLCLCASKCPYVCLCVGVCVIACVCLCLCLSV